MAVTKTLGATEFKATCLEVLDRVRAGEWDRVEVTKRGRVVAVLVPPPVQAEGVAGLHGFMRGSVVTPPGFDLTGPVLWAAGIPSAKRRRGTVKEIESYSPSAPRLLTGGGKQDKPDRESE